MEFNIDKCVVMNIGSLRNKSNFAHKMKNQQVTQIKQIEQVQRNVTCFVLNKPFNP